MQITELRTYFMRFAVRKETPADLKNAVILSCLLETCVQRQPNKYQSTMESVWSTPKCYEIMEYL